MDKKEAEQRKKLDTLNKAAQFLQAHYRGMVARRDMERARKGKKGGKRRKKWEAAFFIKRCLQLAASASIQIC